MIADTIARIEKRLAESSLDPAEKQRLVDLVAQLRQELDALPADSAEKASSVASFAEVAAQEATRGEKNPDLVAHATQGLEKAAHGLGRGYPGLTRIVNQLCELLSDTGI